MVPCKTCLKYPMCINKTIGELLYTCSDLEKFMSESLDNFDVGTDFFIKSKERNSDEKIEKEKD